ncbi:hypothetical protein QTP70_006215 [Hemibagrus guttatus]|uniref:Small monomeric GTPase n=1 Tax=Hemibagrus guttatus TaxID=175788 RepID=A0AAE0V2G3_9TELE|nr:hypothetical protein QTP70_006215 [Hemibagrus guttatus]KAK3561658.1 hypothetical protein QTP86_012500 [Hemibagrus guttatus]
MPQLVEYTQEKWNMFVNWISDYTFSLCSVCYSIVYYSICNVLQCNVLQYSVGVVSYSTCNVLQCNVLQYSVGIVCYIVGIVCYSFVLSVVCYSVGHMHNTSDIESNDYRVVVFGAGGVGKSSLVLRFVKGTFRDTYIPTVEDTYRQVISCDKSVCTLEITDTTGSHQFPAMQRLSISKGHAFILVYSITSRQSLEELKPIYQQVLAIKGNVEGIPIMLVGNKSDESQREVETKEGEAQANSWKCAFMETSAKTNHNVTELFQELLNLDKKRDMSLNMRSSKQRRADKLKAKCSIM